MVATPDFTKLSTSDKLNLIDKIWASIVEPPMPQEISEEMKLELDRRHEELLRDPSQAVDWKEAKAQILREHAKRQDTAPCPS